MTKWGLIIGCLAFNSFGRSQSADTLTPPDCEKAKALVVEATNELDEQRFSDAMDKLDKAIKLCPHVGRAHALYGNILLQKKDYGKAVRHLGLALRVGDRLSKDAAYQLIELSLRLAEYDIANQAIKYALSQKEDARLHQFTTFLGDYKNWLGEYQLYTEDLPYAPASLSHNENQMILSGIEGIGSLGSIKDSVMEKPKKLKPIGIHDVHITSGGKVYYTKRSETTWFVYEGELKKDEIVGEKRIESLAMTGKSMRYPYLDEGQGVLYLSVMTDGQYDICYALLEDDDTWSIPIPLKYINTDKDEIEPYFHRKTGDFYFSSNGYAGFGGFDIFRCDTLEKIGGVLHPKNPENLLYPLNSNLDELSIAFITKHEGIVVKKDLWNKVYSFGFKPAAYRFWQGEKHDPTKE